jgi:hypothetical protein
MTSKKFVKAFIAGMALPAVLLPIAYTMLYLNIHSVVTQHTLQFIPMYLPLAWGVANAIFFAMQGEGSTKNANSGLIVTGACLGFLVAVFGVFVAHIPTMVFGNLRDMQYAPLVVVPVVYAILFRYVVKWINKTVGV